VAADGGLYLGILGGNCASKGKVIGDLVLAQRKLVAIGRIGAGSDAAKLLAGLESDDAVICLHGGRCDQKENARRGQFRRERGRGN
jgi:hypothetical protein